ncbi:MAG TPA: flavin reductase family protein [Caulobacterales bacterium]|nr:flavin reductase family protein [Caulobacterales bacterium]
MEDTEDRRYRRACGAFATGVVVVSTRAADGRMSGLTVNSWSSVSLNPRLIQWCLGNESARFPAFQAAEFWGVTVLGAEEEALALRYARVATETILSDEADLIADVPVLKAGIAHFACRTYARFPAGDHVLLVGEVLDFTSRPGPALTYFRGRYGRAIEPETP